MDKPDVRALAEDVPELEPCPFCGGEAQVGNIVRDMTSISVACCSSCGGQTSAQPWWRYGRDAEPKAQIAAIEAWNRRATSETTKAEGRRQGLEEAALLAEAQPFYPDTHTGTRQQWVKDQIAAAIRAIAQKAEGR